MIEIFVTDIPDRQAASEVLELLHQRMASCRVDIDLEDCDKVLRVKGKDFQPREVIRLVAAKGFCCRVLE
ncbi:MAG: hypothetical protein EOP49_26685 [Sphingobacteriales bacterium]|nr:MAG: hypothetical protein EOP49_26685 [Sphingobacteriales bacterium]